MTWDKTLHSCKLFLDQLPCAHSVEAAGLPTTTPSTLLVSSTAAPGVVQVCQAPAGQAPYLPEPAFPP